MVTDVPENRTTFNFRVKQSRLPLSLEMKELRFFEMSGKLYPNDTASHTFKSEKKSTALLVQAIVVYSGMEV